MTAADPTTRDVIATAIQATREFQTGAAFGVPTEAHRDYVIGVTDAVLTALTAAGYEVVARRDREWGIRWPHGGVTPRPNEDSARALTGRDPATRTLVSRVAAGDWENHTNQEDT